jgi:tetratricopeptide (TPR) repeat protein
MTIEREELPDFDQLWNYADPAATEETFKAILPRAEEPGNKNYHLQLLTQIARTHGLRGDFARAHEILDDVEKELTEEHDVARVRYLLERGRAFNSGGAPEKARPLFEEAWTLATKCGAEFHAVDAVHMIAIVEPDPDQQLEWNRKGLALAEQSTSPRARGWQGPLTHNMGMTYLERGEWDLAREAFGKCAAFHTRRENKGGARIARWCVAHTERRAGHVEKALELQKALLDDYAKAGVEEQGFCAEEVGECLLALGREEEARPWFAKALPMLEKIAWVRKDAKRIERLRELAGK